VVVDETIAEHQAIYDALAAHDAARARAEMRNHVLNSGRRVGAALPQRLTGDRP